LDTQELRRAYQSLPPLEAGDSFWRDRRSELRQRIAADDPAEFLIWPTITSTMFVGEAPYIREQYDALTRDDIDRWHKAIREDEIGKPARLSYAPNISGNLVRQAYCLMLWEMFTSKNLSDMKSIIEIGGGYGAMAKVARRAGFEGCYTIYDLPELSLLQEFYLSACGIEAEFRGPMGRHRRPNLLIALWSLSEMSNQDVDAILDGLMPDGILIASNTGDTTNDLKARFKVTIDYPLSEDLASNLLIR